MKDINPHSKRFENGFSIIELIIIIAVIGVLYSIISAKYQTFVIKSARAEAFQNINSLRALVSSYHQENGAPTSATQVGPNPANDYWYGVSLDDTSTETSCHNSNVYGFALSNCKKARYTYWVGISPSGWQILIMDNGIFCPGYPKYWNDEVQYCPLFGTIRVIRDSATRGCGGPLLVPSRQPCDGF